MTSTHWVAVAVFCLLLGYFMGVQTQESDVPMVRKVGRLAANAIGFVIFTGTMVAMIVAAIVGTRSGTG
jgi:hypothetical protein